MQSLRAAWGETGYISPLAPRSRIFPPRPNASSIFSRTAVHRTSIRSIPKPSLAKYAGKQLPMENLRTERKNRRGFSFTVSNSRNTARAALKSAKLFSPRR